MSSRTERDMGKRVFSVAMWRHQFDRIAYSV